MKKYFVKYLPVEGEINDGDYWIRNGIVSNEIVAHGICDCKRVKLFLCSRDIQVGDECYHTKYLNLGKWALKEGGIQDCVDWHGENVDESHLFKVLGEISPEAIWVKEGDEFEEDDIQQATKLYYWKREYTIYDFQKFFDKSLSKTCSHFTYEGEIEKEGEISLMFKVYTNTYKIKCKCCNKFS